LRNNFPAILFGKRHSVHRHSAAKNHFVESLTAPPIAVKASCLSSLSSASLLQSLDGMEAAAVPRRFQATRQAVFLIHLQAALAHWRSHVALCYATMEKLSGHPQ
jgi:hypothetical protein